MEAIGVVTKTQGKNAVVRVARQSACSGNCHDCSGCGERPMETTAFSEIDLKIGDKVRIESDSASVLSGMFAVFILPLYLPLIGYLILSTVDLGLAGVLGGLILTVVIIATLSKSRWYIRKTQPRVVCKLTKD